LGIELVPHSYDESRGIDIAIVGIHNPMKNDQYSAGHLKKLSLRFSIRFRVLKSRLGNLRNRRHASDADKILDFVDV